MTRSDEMMLSAIRLRVAMQMNGRDVTVEGDRVKVSLHGVPAMVVRFDSGDVRVNGMLQVSRKSAKVLNAVLRTYTDCTVASVEGCWVLESKDGHRIVHKILWPLLYPVLENRRENDKFGVLTRQVQLFVT